MERLTLRVADLMQSEVRTVFADDRIVDAVTTLADAHVTGVPVLDRGQSRRFVGVLSVSDVLEAATECGSGEDRERLFEDTAVRDLMTTKIATIAAASTVKEAAQQMLYQDIHRLFVVEGEELVGVISQTDIVRAVGTARI